MTECSRVEDLFPACKSRKIETSFDGGAISSDGGALLLRQIDRQLGLTARIGRCLRDERVRGRSRHRVVEMIRQRVYGLALGYEDLNDHDTLRHDVLLQTATDRVEALASASTLSRFENRSDRAAALAISEALVEQFVTSFKKAPSELILDFDATDDPVHGQQEGRFFHGYYDHYCFLPLYVFCGSQLLVSYLRPSNIDGARHTWAILSLLVRRLRAEWPEVRIIFRGDSGFCRWRIMRWCDRHQVDYILGLAKNKRINEIASPLLDEAERRFTATGEKQRLFKEAEYAAYSWDRARRVIMKAEHSSQGRNPRYVVTSLTGDAQALYDDIYVARGDMENRIKEQQLDLFSDRTSCHHWWANQFRLLLSSIAYVLVERMRALALRRTELAKAQCGTIRLKLFKIGAVVTRNTRRVRIHLSSAYPHRELFELIAKRLAIE